MKGKVLFVVGLGVGYVLGTRAGRERYEQIKSAAQRVWESPTVQKQVHTVQNYAADRIGDLGTVVTDGLKRVVTNSDGSRSSAARSSASGTRSGSARSGSSRSGSSASKSGSAKASGSGSSGSKSSGGKSSGAKSGGGSASKSSGSGSGSSGSDGQAS
ncbi:YtxH domain-containing protein [Planctomonas sp. JC2975]|uniref:YtxH domain-containing protein n=1 Tax=Planctomonas sp. JC2975 TaxID=2729626 RepID=UPI0014759337|nr:YtxH domain-containing protein [Planctomonas sp. JC2975]NNC12675.1 YtxH domain-containing protein [Planctomonas sp. JC2975]